MTQERYNKTLGVLRLAATFALVAGLVAAARPRPVGVAVGFLIAATGEAIRFWAAGHLLKTEELVTAGPYRYTRNPLYLGRLLIFTGLCVMALLPWGLNWAILAVGYAVFFGYYLPRKERVEPNRLRLRHGDAFDRYYRAVPALIPSRTPWPQPSPGVWSSERMVRNREHWMVFGLLAITAFLMWRAYQPPEIESAPEPPAGTVARP